VAQQEVVAGSRALSSLGPGKYKTRWA
jgi:hypothetical protein